MVQLTVCVGLSLPLGQTTFSQYTLDLLCNFRRNLSRPILESVTSQIGQIGRVSCLQGAGAVRGCWQTGAAVHCTRPRNAETHWPRTLAGGCLLCASRVSQFRPLFCTSVTTLLIHCSLIRVGSTFYYFHEHSDT